MIDIHCHLLPGLDDGPSDIDESLALAKELARLGFCCVCVTPHRSWNGKNLSSERISGTCNELTEKFREEKLDLVLSPAAEHYITDIAEMLAQETLMCYPRGDTFLMEFALGGFPARLDELLFRVQVKSKVPVIAHIERYPEVQKNPFLAEDLRSRGCYLLTNITSLGGGWDRRSEKTAKILVTEALVDAVTTDLHSIQGLPALIKGLEAMKTHLPPESVHRMLVSAPAEIAGLKQDFEESQ